jgi:hypothetical protein
MPRNFEPLFIVTVNPAPAGEPSTHGPCNYDWACNLAASYPRGTATVAPAPSLRSPGGWLIIGRHDGIEAIVGRADSYTEAKRAMRKYQRLNGSEWSLSCVPDLGRV